MRHYKVHQEATISRHCLQLPYFARCMLDQQLRQEKKYYSPFLWKKDIAIAPGMCSFPTANNIELKRLNALNARLLRTSNHISADRCIANHNIRDSLPIEIARWRIMKPLEK